MSSIFSHISLLWMVLKIWSSIMVDEYNVFWVLNIITSSIISPKYDPYHPKTWYGYNLHILGIFQVSLSEMWWDGGDVVEWWINLKLRWPMNWPPRTTCASYGNSRPGPWGPWTNQYDSSLTHEQWWFALWSIVNPTFLFNIQLPSWLLLVALWGCDDGRKAFKSWAEGGVGYPNQSEVPVENH